MRGLGFGGFRRQERDLVMSFSQDPKALDAVDSIKQSSSIAIRVSNLSKVYQIYERPEDRLRQSIYPRINRFFGRQVKNYYREFFALEDISFEVAKGETIGIIGRNGAGKSTLLQIICETLHATSGSVLSYGRVAALLELGSGFNPEFTGRENVYMYASILGLSKQETDEKYADITDFAGIGDFINQPVKSYSSGMLVRLAFSVIAHVEADILIIDEALSVGDAFFTQKCMRFLRDFMKDGTVLFVSHDTAAVLNLCNRAICLRDGKITASGSPNDVVASYLEDVYNSEQGSSVVNRDSSLEDNVEYDQEKRDMRLDYFNQTNLRNDIELFCFSPDAPDFGKGGAKVIQVQLLDPDNKVLSWVVGGEKIKLRIDCLANESLISPIVGFLIKDRLGQILFSDNTYIQYRGKNISIKKGSKFYAIFEFYMPVLPAGEYSISPAIATGTQEEHVQHHWLHDAMIFKVHSSSVCLGLMGLQMTNIELDVAM